MPGASGRWSGWRGRAAFGALALAVYAAATAAIVWPVLARFGDVVPYGDGSADSYIFVWDLWWVRQVLAGDPGGVAGQSLFHTRMLFWPEGTSLALHTLVPALGVAAAPLGALWPGTEGLVRIHAVLTALSFVATGGAVLLLARQAGASRGAALGAGLVALLQPYRLHHLNHLNLLSLWVGLLSLWLLVRVLRHGRLADAGGLAGAALLASATDLEMTVHVALAAAVLVVVDAVTAWRSGALAARRSAWRALAVAGALAVLLHLPILAAVRAAGPVAAPPATAAELLSANLAGFTGPGARSVLHEPLAALVPPGGHGLAGDEVFLGVAFAVALGTLVAVAARRRGGFGGAGPWLAVGGACLVLSLGPTLHAGAHDGLRGLMPWSWLTRLAPFLSQSRSPVRLVHLGGLALAVALAVLVTRIAGASGDGGGTRSPRRARVRAAALGAVFLVLAAERWPATAVAVEQVHVPEAYRRLAAEPGPFAILESPDDYVMRNRYLLWQTVHGKPMVLGQVSRAPVRAERWLRQLAAEPPEIRDAILGAVGVRYEVVHPPGGGALAEPRLERVAPLDGP